MKNFLDRFRDSRWSSRKFLLTAATLLIILLNEVLGLKIDQEIYWQLIGALSAYVLGESIIDASRENNKDKKE